MPSDLTVKAVSPVIGASESPAEPKPDFRTPPAHAPPSGSPPVVNPSLRLDAALGLVVIEFRDASGKLTTTIPSQQQLQAYRAASAAHSGARGHAGRPPRGAARNA